jgi:hypothetical protein
MTYANLFLFLNGKGLLKFVVQFKVLECYHSFLKLFKSQKTLDFFFLMIWSIRILTGFLSILSLRGILQI